MMKKIAFKMKLKEGVAEEYKRRHDVIWPELAKLIADAGISDYTIFLDEETNLLFAVQQVAETNSQELASNEIVQKWWAYMSDIMEVNNDLSPISIPLTKVFHLD